MNFDDHINNFWRFIFFSETLLFFQILKANFFYSEVMHCYFFHFLSVSSLGVVLRIGKADLLIACSTAAILAALPWDPAPMKVFPFTKIEYTTFSSARGGRFLWNDNICNSYVLNYFNKKCWRVPYINGGFLNFSATYWSGKMDQLESVNQIIDWLVFVIFSVFCKRKPHIFVSR